MNPSQMQKQQQQQQQQQQYPNLIPDEAGNIIEQRKRGESIDMFLSRSPSQSLGSEFLKFRNDEHLDAIPALSLNPKSTANVGFDRSKKIHAQFHGNHLGSGDGSSVHNRSLHGRGDMSPSCSVTGTSASSRSASPSWNSNDNRRGGQTIRAYQQTPPGMIPNGNVDLGRQQHIGQISAHQEPFLSNNLPGMHSVANNYMDMNTSYDQHNHRDMHNMQHQQQVHQHQQIQLPQGFILPTNDRMMGQQQPGMSVQQSVGNDSKAQQGQVFYVAVPTQDGQGQVLQPIQMVQLPGQPNAFVLPSTAPSNSIQFPSQQGMGGMPQNHFIAPQGGRGCRQIKQQQPFHPGLADMFLIP